MSLSDYYTEQAGSGLAYYQGRKFQSGHGLGLFFKSAILPLLKRALPFIGKQVINTGIDLADGLKSGENIKSAATNALKRRGAALAEDALVAVKNKMTGSGIRRRRRRRVAPKKMLIRTLIGKTRKRKRRRRAPTKSKRRSSAAKAYLF